MRFEELSDYMYISATRHLGSNLDRPYNWEFSRDKYISSEQDPLAEFQVPAEDGYIGTLGTHQCCPQSTILGTTRAPAPSTGSNAPASPSTHVFGALRSGRRGATVDG